MNTNGWNEQCEEPLYVFTFLTKARVKERDNLKKRAHLHRKRSDIEQFGSSLILDAFYKKNRHFKAVRGRKTNPNFKLEIKKEKWSCSKNGRLKKRKNNVHKKWLRHS